MGTLERRSGSSRYYLELITLNQEGETIWIRGPKDLRKILDSETRDVTLTLEDSHEDYVGKTISGRIEEVVYKNPHLPENSSTICLKAKEFYKKRSPEVIRINIHFIPTDEKSRYVAQD